MTDTRPIATLLAEAQAGKRAALARVLSAVESGGPEADSVSRRLDLGVQGFILGVTGAPGAGKSTLAGALIRHLRGEGQRVAVLAVDPSSPFSGGALLGDRLRMTGGARDSGVFIRSMASRGQQGGLASATQTAALVLHACDWPLVIIETVGAGQAEVDIAAAADLTLVVVNPGWGDAVQAHKAGLMEVGDIFAINKADRGDVEETRADMAGLLAAKPAGSPPVPIVATVAINDEGIAELWREIDQQRRRASAGSSGRTERLRKMLELSIQQRLDATRRALLISEAFELELAQLTTGATTLPEAVDRLLASIKPVR